MPEALSDQNKALSGSGTHRASRVATLPREQLKVRNNFQDWHKIGAALTRLAQLGRPARIPTT